MLRLLRLLKVLSFSKNSRRMNAWREMIFDRFNIEPAILRLLRLAMVLLLGWHYTGCVWWFIGTEARLVVL